jgi:hypothetical protein
MYIQNVDIKTEEFYRKVADKGLLRVEAHILLLEQRECNFQMLYVVFEGIGKDTNIVDERSTIFLVFLQRIVYEILYMN